MLLCRVTFMAVSKGNGEVQSDDLGARRRPAVEDRGIVSDAHYCGPWGPEDTPHCTGLGVTHCFPGPVTDGLDVHQAGPGYVSAVRAPQGPQACRVPGGLVGPRGPHVEVPPCSHSLSPHRRGEMSSGPSRFFLELTLIPWPGLMGQHKAHGHGDPHLCPQGDPEASGPLQLTHPQPVPQSSCAWDDPKGGAGAIVPG